MSIYITDSADLEAVANRIRKASGETKPLEFPDGFIAAIPDGIPKGLKIKYIIPATFIPPRTADDYGYAAIPFTFTRENVNQLFNVDWQLQDATDTTNTGYWVQHMFWSSLYQGHYASQHTFRYDWVFGGTKGNSIYSKVAAMSKTALTMTHTWGENTTTDAAYKRRGNVFKGLIFITDSSYDGEPIVDATKLSQFFECDYITAGW